MRTYKGDQGRLARMFAFWGTVFVSLFGCTFLYSQLFQHVASWREPLGGLHIPIVSVAVNVSFLISGGLFVALVLLIRRWQGKPDVADALIDTESELRKVTWPSFQEVINSTLVVVAFVIFLMGFLALMDWLLGAIFARILGLGGGA